MDKLTGEGFINSCDIAVTNDYVVTLSDLPFDESEEFKMDVQAVIE